MIDTNLLIALSFSIITNFARIASIPDENVPRSVGDLQCHNLGDAYSPLDLTLIGPHEANYCLRDGVVQFFGCPDDVFHEQDPGKLDNYLGASTMSSNGVLMLASNVIAGLIVDTNIGSLKNQAPNLIQAGEVRPFPFFRVEWPNIWSDSAASAVVDIDARIGRVVMVQLLDLPFSDLGRWVQISNAVWKADVAVSPVAAPARAAMGPAYPRPPEEQVNEALAKWPVFCEKVGLHAGNAANEANIDWTRSGLMTNRPVLGGAADCKFVFLNGATCSLVDGTIVCGSADWAFIDRNYATRARRLSGTILKDWRELATNLVRTLQNNLGIPAAKLAPFKPNCQSKPPEMGTKTMKRATVEWRIWPEQPGRTAYINESQLGLIADFDLETGELKGIEFYDQALIDCLTQALGSLK